MVFVFEKVCHSPYYIYRHLNLQFALWTDKQNLKIRKIAKSGCECCKIRKI